MATPRWVNGESGAAPSAWLWPLAIWAAAAILAVGSIFSVWGASWLLTAIAGGLPLLIAGGLQMAWTTGRNSRVRLNEERAEIAAMLHDLRGPLLTARSYLDLLGSDVLGTLPPEAMDGVQRAAAATARAQALAAAIGAPTPPASAWERVELASLLDEVLAALAGEISSSGAKVTVQALPTVRGERQALYRVFANLIENAIKFAQPGSAPRIALSAEQDGSRPVIAVRDWGIGIPLAEHDRVFEPRQRGSEVGNRPGSGLGLATVRRLVRAQHGDVWVSTHAASGSCIHVALPAA